jgi:hypothetical protein
MSDIRLASNAELTERLLKFDQPCHRLGALEFGMPETVRLFRVICWDLR